MGLPSGVQWANCNIGAAGPSDLGLYFSWGNIEGHAIGEGYNFSQSAYNSSPAASIDTDLTLEQDAARAYLGDPWRMPTSNEIKELCDNCTIVWTEMNGVNGRLFRSNVNGNKLFFPAAGQYSDTSLNNRGSWGFYWPSTYYSESRVRSLTFNSVNVDYQNSVSRHYGFSIRAVIQL